MCHLLYRRVKTNDDNRREERNEPLARACQGVPQIKQRDDVQTGAPASGGYIRETGGPCPCERGEEEEPVDGAHQRVQE